MLVSDQRVPHDRRVYYAVEGIGGLRLGEAVALRIHHIELDREPLGRLLWPSLTGATERKPDRSGRSPPPGPVRHRRGHDVRHTMITLAREDRPTSTSSRPSRTTWAQRNPAPRFTPTSGIRGPRGVERSSRCESRPIANLSPAAIPARGESTHCPTPAANEMGTDTSSQPQESIRPTYALAYTPENSEAISDTYVVEAPGTCPRPEVSGNLRRDGTLAGNPRRSQAEAVPRRPTVWSCVPVGSAGSRQRNGNGRERAGRRELYPGAGLRLRRAERRGVKPIALPALLGWARLLGERRRDCLDAGVSVPETQECVRA
jgi:hypothetical protein